MLTFPPLVSLLSSFQLVQNENLKGVVSMNEDYELKFMAMDGRVSGMQI